MKFEGALLQRGFWLYVWEIKGDQSHHVYVGRTGDSSSPHAQSPFKRIGQHLDPSPKAKGNALGKQLTSAGVKHEGCTFEMVAIGPLFPEQQSMAKHIPVRDQMAALERAVADHLKKRGYAVLGTHPRIGKPDPSLLSQVHRVLVHRFPQVRSNNAVKRTLAVMWKEQYDRIGRGIADLRVYYKGKSGYEHYDGAAEFPRFRDHVMHLFQDIFHLRDWLINDAAVNIPDADLHALFTRNFDKWPALHTARDVANAGKHLVLTMQPSVSKDAAVAKTGHLAINPSGDMKDTVIKHSIAVQIDASNAEDALALAERCLKEWHAFLSEKGLR